MEAITSKRRFYELWSKGLLGNKPHSWDTLEEALNSGFLGTMIIRYRGTGSGGPFIVNLPLDRLSGELEKLIKQGWKEEDFFFYESLQSGAPTCLINGELMRSHRGLELTYSTENAMLRHALRRSGKSVSGVVAQETLRYYLDPGGIEDLADLLDAWPDHVIEFSVFNQKLGVLHQRMIIWEVRLY